MSEPAKPNGRKYTLTKAALWYSVGVTGLSFALGLLGRLTPEWVQVVTIALPAVAGVVASFSAANAYVTGKTAGTDSQGG